MPCAVPQGAAGPHTVTVADARREALAKAAATLAEQEAAVGEATAEMAAAAAGQLAKAEKAKLGKRISAVRITIE